MPSKLAVASPLLLLPFRVFLPVLAHSAFIPFFFHLELLVLCLLSCFFSPSFGRRKRQTEGAQSAIYMVSFDVAVPCHTYPYSTLHSLIRCFILPPLRPTSPMLRFRIYSVFPSIFHPADIFLSLELLNPVSAACRVHERAVDSFAHAFL